MPLVPEKLVRQMLELEAADAPDWDRVLDLAAELRSGTESGVFGDISPVIASYVGDVHLRRSNREAGAEHFALRQAEMVTRHLDEQLSREAA